MSSASLRLLSGIPLLLVLGCSDDDVPSTMHRPAVTLELGGYAVRVDPDGPGVAFLRGSEILLDFPADGFQLGAVAALDDGTNYDPYPLLVPNGLQPDPDGLAWLAVERIDIIESTPAALSLALSCSQGKRATLRVEATADGRFDAALTPAEDGAPIAFLRLRPRIDGAEGLYGLGEYYDDVNQRGKVRAMQIEIDPAVESHYNEAHVPIPFLTGTRGWGLFVESPYPGVFDVAARAGDRVEATLGTGLASTKGLAFHLFGAEHPLDLTRFYYDVTGYPRLPARWALGPWLWRDENKDQAQVEADLDAMRDLDLAATGLWIDRPYATGVNTFDWNAPQFPDPQAMLDKLRALGFRSAVWHTPYLDEKDASTAALRAEATAGGYYPPHSGVLLNKWGQPIDLTNPDAYAWWQDHVKQYTAMGIEGFKLDYGEDVLPGITSSREPWSFADGSDERTMHGRFQLFYHRVYAETLPEEGGFLLCRHGTYGDQTNVSVIWPGDLDASFAHRGEETKEGDETYVAVGGLPASVVAGLSLGPSGFPFYGADTGGYVHSPPDKELFTRWFEQTALSTVMQIGNSASTVAWEPDPKTGYDEEMLGWYRTYTRLHLRLFPYVWTYARKLAEDGRPIQRALGLAYPELGVHPNDIYLLGDELLVAPVLARGVTKRDVTFPPGSWIDWWTGEAHAGGMAESVDAPLEKLPLFVRAGGIVAMLRPTIDAIGPTTEPDRVDSYATTPGLLYARVARGPDSTVKLFDGSVLAQAGPEGPLTLSYAPSSEFQTGAVFEVIAFGSKPTAVTEAGKPLDAVATALDLEAAATGWTFVDETGGTLLVKVAAGAHEIEVSP